MILIGLDESRRQYEELLGERSDISARELGLPLALEGEGIFAFVCERGYFGTLLPANYKVLKEVTKQINLEIIGTKWDTTKRKNVPRKEPFYSLFDTQGRVKQVTFIWKHILSTFELESLKKIVKTNPPQIL